MPFIKTQLVITNVEQITTSGEGAQTIGELINRQLAQSIFSESGEARPHSVEIGFETDSEWFEFRQNARNSGAYQEFDPDAPAKTRKGY